jgi:membrane protein DedA with SNARE-associated domain
MSAFFDSIIHLLINFINQIGYFGIFFGMFLESTVVPIPSELIMIPAGISASHGSEINIYIAIICGTLGNIAGALFSYYLASSIGRKILFYIGKYFFVKPSTIIKIEDFFKNHGPISVLIGRLLPVFRHFISLFAGIAKMDLRLFFIYTTIGSSIWTTILAVLGYFIGENQELIKEHLNDIIIACVLLCIAIIAIYIFRKPARK